jgi:hypothetical protein
LRGSIVHKSDEVAKAKVSKPKGDYSTTLSSRTFKGRNRN